MNKKSIFTIILALLLALICSFAIMNKKTKPVVKEDYQQIEQNIIEAVESSDNTEIIENKKEENLSAKSIEENKNIVIPLKENITKEDKTNDKETNVIQEASIVEEVTDYGIMKDEDGFISITREFKTISPAKFYFKDFGIIEKISK